MIIFFSAGRLGNQIFQYSFINKLRKGKEKVLVSGFDDLMDVFEIKDVINISRKHRITRGLIFRILSPVLNFLGSIRLITKIQVKFDDPPGFENIHPRRESSSYYVSKGRLESIRFINTGYFQSESFFNKEILKLLNIKKEHLQEAESFLSDIPENSHRVFVHIRRGDYKDFTIFDKSTLLPLTYYHKCMDYFINNYENIFFIFLSDDPKFIEGEFKRIKMKKISKNKLPGTDLAIITKCRSGILSTSTFGWWGGYLIKDKDIILAPKYWLGFKSEIDYPVGGFPSFAKEVKINPTNEIIIS